MGGLGKAESGAVGGGGGVGVPFQTWAAPVDFASWASSWAALGLGT